jgi:hypothetical protein
MQEAVKELVEVSLNEAIYLEKQDLWQQLTRAQELITQGKRAVIIRDVCMKDCLKKNGEHNNFAYITYFHLIHHVREEGRCPKTISLTSGAKIPWEKILVIDKNLMKQGIPQKNYIFNLVLLDQQTQWYINANRLF